jgi:uncharacterized membrane protein YqjE
LQEERLHLTQMLLFALIAIFCFGMGLLLLTIFIVVLFWDDYRLAVLGGLSLLFFLLGMLIAAALRARSRSKTKLFSASIAEFAKDREHLGAGHE